jgi:hypothetical protein
MTEPDSITVDDGVNSNGSLLLKQEDGSNVSIDNGVVTANDESPLPDY